MRAKNEFRQIAGNPPLPIKLTAIVATSSDSSVWRRIVARWRGRRHFTLAPKTKERESTSMDIANIEERVRKELYPSKIKYIVPVSSRS
jgi:hypothetical protein